MIRLANLPLPRRIIGCRGKQVVFSKPDSKFKLVVTPTNEELMIAMETVKLTAK